MFIDDKRVSADTAVPLQNGNKVCFGVNSDINDFKYEFVPEEVGTAILRRCGINAIEGKLKLSPSPSPPLVMGKRRLSEDQRASANKSVPKKKPRLSEEKDTCVKARARCTLDLERDCVEKDSDTAKPKKTCVLMGSSEADPKSSPVLSVASSKPSPAFSIASTRSASDLDMDELFDGGEDKCAAIMEEAIFGESNQGSSKVLKERCRLDATTIQIQLAREQMDKEKHKLLSSIEALRSELAAKDQLLAEKDEKTKAAEDVGNSVVSSMQEEFTCVICQELFINAYTLHCAHSFCEWCIKEWMKRKGHKDCPICRKKIISDPVHSLALDNAVSKLVEKLTDEEQKERKDTETEHKNALANLNQASSKTAKSSKTTPASSGVSTRSSVARMAAAATPSSTSASLSTSRTIVIDLSRSPAPRRTSVTHPIVVDTSTETESDSDTDGSETDSDDSDAYDSGLEGVYYGGYGRCFSCGELIIGLQKQATDSKLCG